MSKIFFMQFFKDYFKNKFSSQQSIVQKLASIRLNENNGS